jgi:NADH dehydrogenase FAD-containing subunit
LFGLVFPKFKCGESAVEEGKYVGKLIARELDYSLKTVNSGYSRALPFRYKEKGIMLSIGAHGCSKNSPGIPLLG